MVCPLRLICLVFIIASILIFCPALAVPSLSSDLSEHPHLLRDRIGHNTDNFNFSHSYRPISIKTTNSSAGFAHPRSQQRSVLLINGTADDSFIVTFLLEPETLSSNYSFVFLSNDSRILDLPEDVSSIHTETPSSINATIAPDFHLFPGKVQLSIEARRTSDNSLVDVYNVDYLVAGLAVFEKETGTLISGAGRSFSIPSYVDIYTKPHWEFSVFVQYTNGSNSDFTCQKTCGEEVGSRSLYIDMISVELMYFGGQVSWDESICSLADGTWKNNTIHLKSGCGIGICPAYLNGTQYDGFRLALNLQTNRAGKFGVFMTWDDFTVGSDLEGEEMTNYVVIIVDGQPPATVRRIEPANPFDREGGEVLCIETTNTEDANIISFNVNEVPFDYIPGSRSINRGSNDFYESYKFSTKAGKGKRLPWSITATRLQNGSLMPVEFIDETGFLFSYNDEDILIKKITPSSVSADGDALMTITGEFPQFDAEALNHGVFIGNVPIERERFFSFSSSEITILVPPRSSIGVSWRFRIFVQIDEAFSNEVELIYLPLSMEIRGVIFGASNDVENGNYNIGPCGITTLIVTVIDQEQRKDVTYMWKMFDEEHEEYLSLSNASSIATNTDTLGLPSDQVPRFNEVFQVMAVISFLNLTRTLTFNIQKVHAHVIGVTLLQPENRTISVPPVNVRIIAKIEIPDCAEMPNELLYEWELENKTKTLNATFGESSDNGFRRRALADQNSSVGPEFDLYTFSYENNTGTNDDEVTPTRLGREFIIPREMVHNGTYQVKLTVKGTIINSSAALTNSSNYTINTLISGFDATTFTIKDSSLVAIIGSGQISRRVSDSETLTITAEESFDPDILEPDESRVGLSFEWACGVSLYRNLSNVAPCVNSLLPNNSHGNVSSFEIPNSTLQLVSNGSLNGEENVYLRYELTIKKGPRRSTAAQVLTLTRSSGQRAVRYNRIEIVNSLDETVNPDAVEFWEDVVIRPTAPLTTEWRFRLERPITERSRFLTRPGNLISSAGYYTVPGQGVPGFQQLPLGIHADRLQPKQNYEFLVSFQEADRLSDDVTIRLKTVEVPKLVFPDISNANGSMFTTFRATASTSFEGNSKFTYQFYLIEHGNNSSEYCVDGCTGGYTVRFQIQKAGLYTLQCRLFAANGKRLLVMKNNTKRITVFPSPFPPPKSSFSLSAAIHVSTSSLLELDEAMFRDFRLGDDGWVAQRGFYASEWLFEKDSQVSVNSDSYDICANYTARWIWATRHIVANELPNSANARNYIVLATNYVRIGCVEHEDTLYELLNIVDQSISRTPQEELLTTQSKSMPGVELHEDLRRFYNFTFCKAAQLVGQGSSRVRLLSQPGKVYNLMIDVAELSIQHLTTTATSGRVCGWEQQYNFGTWDGVPDCLGTHTPASMPAQRMGFISVQVAVKCNREHGTSLRTRHAGFEWCDAVYDLSGNSRKLVTLAEIFDYPYLSGIQGRNHSETERIVLVDITSLEKGNRPRSVMSSADLHAIHATQVKNDKGRVQAGQVDQTKRGKPMCYKIGMVMAPKVEGSSQCSINTPFRMAPRKEIGYLVSKPFQDGLYARHIDDIYLTGDSSNSSLNVSALSNELGLYGAYRLSCDNQFRGLFGNSVALLAGIFIGIFILIIIITGLVYLLLSIILGASTRSEDEAGLIDDAYVDRDYFGRKDIPIEFENQTESSEASIPGTPEHSAAAEVENVEVPLDGGEERPASPNNPASNR